MASPESKQNSKRHRLDSADIIVSQLTARQLRVFKGALVLAAIVMAINVANLLSIALAGLTLDQYLF